MNRNFVKIFITFAFSKASCYQRCYSSSYKNVCVQNLKYRTLLQVYGPDATNYLQGLITNDIHILESEDKNKSSIYTLILNDHGRVLFDTLIYKINDNDYFLEYDSAGTERIKKHLGKYILRKDVKIQPVNNVSVWTAYIPYEKFKYVDISEVSNVIETVKTNRQIILTACDPRLKHLGSRIITENIDLKSILQCPEEDIENAYDIFRYQLGIGEGVIDHPPGSCLPFETNVDFLNGVNFQKGCYIGQELTAKVHFTGVIRKRIMPIILSSSQKVTQLPTDSGIFSDKRKMGKLRNNIGKYGIATLSVDESLKANELKLKDFNADVSVIRPEWWPEDMYKIKH